MKRKNNRESYEVESCDMVNSRLRALRYDLPSYLVTLVTLHLSLSVRLFYRALKELDCLVAKTLLFRMLQHLYCRY